MKRVKLRSAPKWAQAQMPKRHVPIADLTLICLPGMDTHVVASAMECREIAEPDSFLGQRLRPHACIMGLIGRSNN